MRNLTGVFVTMILTINFAFSQLIMTGGIPGELSKPYFTYKIDTLKVYNDSVFVLVKQYENDTLTFQEEQVFLPGEIIFHGHSIELYKNGQKKCEGTFNLGKRNNDWLYWDKFGGQVPQELVSSDIQIRRCTYIYIDGKKVELKPTKSNCVSSFDSTLQVQLYTLADKEPEYIGGTSALLSFFLKNFCYPKDQEDFQGAIYITLIIDTDGKASNIGIYRKYDGDNLSLVDKEAIRVFKLMPSWTPGQCEGKNVPMKITIPIRF